MLLYRIICLVLFVVVMSTLAHYVTGFGEWSHGFAWGIAIGGFFGMWAATIERRERSDWPQEKWRESLRDSRKGLIQMAIVVAGCIALVWTFYQPPHDPYGPKLADISTNPNTGDRVEYDGKQWLPIPPGPWDPLGILHH